MHGALLGGAVVTRLGPLVAAEAIGGGIGAPGGRLIGRFRLGCHGVGLIVGSRPGVGLYQPGHVARLARRARRPVWHLPADPLLDGLADRLFAAVTP